MTWQDLSNDIDDLEDWTPFKGAFSCLMFLAQCCPNIIDLYIIPEVSNRIKVEYIRSNLFSSNGNSSVNIYL